MNLMPGVINVLIDYELRRNNNKLIKVYIENTASQWKRSNIETVIDAMNLAEKEYSKTKKVKKTDGKSIKEEPLWLKDDIKKAPLSEEKKQKMENLLKKYR